MSLTAALTTFALIFPVELPDKTFVATLVLATRYPARWVWLGVAAAFAVQCAIAVTAGGLLSLLPERVVLVGAAVLFTVGAVVLWRSARGADAAEQAEEAELAGRVTAPASGWRASLVCFGVLFAAEWGDLSQLTTAGLAARFADPPAVFAGSWLALVSVAAIGALAGRALLRVVRPSLLKRVAGTLFAGLAALTWTAALAAAAGAAPAAAPAPGTAPDGPVVLVGVGSLAWEDVSESGTPTLWSLAGRSAAASLTVKSVRRTTCLVDGWLTLSAGRRAADAERQWCRPVPRPRLQGETVSAGEWQQLVSAQDDYPYDPTMGLLGDSLAAAGACATAVGPGGSLALARSDGTVDRYLPSSLDLDGTELARCPVTVVDLGWLPRREAAAERAEQASAVDRELARLAEELPEGGTLLVVGVSDSGPTVRPEAVPGDDDQSGEPTEKVPDPNQEAPVLSPEDVFPFPPPGLRLAAATGPDGAGDAYGPSWIISPSTRWAGMVQLTDVTPTLLEHAGLPRPSALVGLPWRQAGPHPPTAADTVRELIGADTAAQIFRTQSGTFFQLLGAVEITLAALAVLLAARATSPLVRRRVTTAAYAGALLFASFPVASFLANLVRWWLTDRPTVVLWGAITGWAVALTALALAGPWRHRVYGPSGVVAGVTALVLAADVATGAHLQHSSLLGLSPLVAGRFYGLGNIPFAVYAAATLVAVGAVGQWLVDRGAGRQAAGMAALALGGSAVVVNGSPAAGADFGGMLALGPAVGLLVFGISGWRPSPRRVLAVGAVSVGVVVTVSLLDWFRPVDARSHLGDFVQEVIDGEALTTVTRKGLAALGTLGRPYGWIAVVALVAVVLVMRAPDRWRAGALVLTFGRWPFLRPVAWAGVAVSVLGFAVNDSGIVIPALVLVIGVPLVVSAVAAALLRAAPGARPAHAPRAPTAGHGAPGPASPSR